MSTSAQNNISSELADHCLFIISINKENHKMISKITRANVYRQKNVVAKASLSCVNEQQRLTLLIAAIDYYQILQYG